MAVEDIFSKLQALIAEQFAIEADSITMDTAFEEDLGADSVDQMELVMAIEEEFEMEETQEEELNQLKTVGDVVQLVSSKLKD